MRHSLCFDFPRISLADRCLAASQLSSSPLVAVCSRSFPSIGVHLADSICSPTATVQGGLLGALVGFFGELGSLFTCIGGALSPKGPIPGLLSTLLHITAPISSIVSVVRSDVSSVISGVNVTSVLPTPAASAVGAATSVAGAAAGAATSAAGGLVSKAAGAVGSVAGGLGLRERDRALSGVLFVPSLID